MDKRLATAIAIVVTCVWAISFVADIVLKDYDPSPYVHLAMMMVVGAAVGSSAFKRVSGKNGSNGKESE